MTRKDYVALADAFAWTRPPERDIEPGRGPTTTPYFAQWRVTRDAVASVLQYDNPRFDRARFVRATEA